jgi:YesN/AraC family two-component response regulator
VSDVAAPIRVLVVDDQALFREALTTLLSVPEEIEVVGEAANGQDALRLVADLSPDVVLMDLRMPEMNGVSASQKYLAWQLLVRGDRSQK